MKTKGKRVLTVALPIVAALVLAGCGGLGMVDVKLSMEKYDEAVADLDAYLAEHPDSADARARLGYAYLKKDRPADAVAQLERALTIRPGDSYAVLYLGLAHLKNGDLGRAIDVWQGFRDRTRPLVEEEIRRQLTLLMIAESQRAARKALAEEAKLAAAPPEADTYTVTYYQDLSPDRRLAAFQKGLAAMVITDLSRVEGIRVVERTRLQALLEEMRLGQTGIVDPATAPRLGRLLGAEHVVVGSLAVGSIQAVTTLQSTSRGAVAGSVSASVPEASFYELPGMIVRAISQMAGIQLSGGVQRAIGEPQTRSWQAVTYYGQGLDALDGGNWAEARNFFNRALQEDPAFALAREGAETSPPDSAPSVAALKSMSVPQIADTVETAVEDAREAQEAADKAAEAAVAAACFAYDTRVLMADGSHKRVIDVRRGDLVRTRDVETGRMVERTVSHKYRGDQDHYYRINRALRMTDSHPVLLEDGRWVNVEALRVGDRIAGLDGTVTVETIERVPHEHRVYYLGVEGTHNYFVSAYGTDFITVHNSSGGGK